MTVKRGHQIIKLLPIQADKETTHHQLYLHHNPEPYDPPTYINNMLFNAANRPDAKTPLAFHYHLSFGCASEAVLRHTQQHVCGMQVQKGSWKTLKSLLPCSACLAGKMRKQNNPQAKDFTDLANLAISWNAATEQKRVRPNEEVSVDWGIINKRAIPGKNNVFALYLDMNTGLVFAYPAPSRGLAGPSLQAYIQQHGAPTTIISDNAKEFKGGEFAEICKTKEIRQKMSAPLRGLLTMSYG